MGVLGLWQLLQPSSRATKIEGLEGKVLAIDILLVSLDCAYLFDGIVIFP
jgi:hypothetical protein